MARRNDSENLNDSNLEKVIELLSASKPITKKAACEILGIAYNVSRLDALIQKHKEKKEFFSRKYKEKLGTSATQDEINDIVSSTLLGESVAAIAKRNFRTESMVRTVLKQVGCPTRDIDSSYQNPPLIPDSSVKEEFLVGEKVYSARYQSLASIRCKTQTKSGTAYGIWVEQEGNRFHAYQPWWELASLEHLKNYGVKI